MRNIVLIFLFFSSSFIVNAQTKLAFIKVYQSNGTLLQLEENGEFTHIAISIDNRWLHAHPSRGVEFVDTIEEIGYLKFEVIMLENKQLSLSEGSYSRFLNLPYDGDFIWTDDAIYCSELIAKILGIKPTPMTFSARVWGGEHPSKGLLGISPDEIFNEAKNIGFRELLR